MTDRSALPRDPVRLGIIGTGLAAKKLHWPALARMPERFVVVAFSNRTRATAEEFAAQAGLSMAGYHADYRDLLARRDVEAVLVGVPIPQLYRISRDCLAAGKHVIAEKPPGANLAEGRSFVALGEEYPGLKLLMAENCFYRDDLRLARALVDDGVIGRPQFLLERWVERNVPTPGAFSSTPWRYHPDYPGGPLLDGGVHAIAALRLLGGDVARLYARAERANATMDAPSVLTMSLDFAGGAIGNCVMAFVEHPVLDEVGDRRLYGSAGNLVASPRLVRVARPDGSVEEHRIEGNDGGYYNEFLNFYEAVVHDEPIAGTAEQSFRNMVVVLRALESSEQGQPAGLEGGPGVPLWRPRGSGGLFDGLPVRVTRVERPAG